MRAPIHSKKHFHQITLSTATTLAVSNTTVIDAVAIQAVDAPNEIQEGAIVKAVFVELWVIGATLDQFFTIIFAKYPAGAGAASFTEMTNLSTWDNKKNILFTTQGLANNDGVSGVVPVMRQWFKIPKGKQRFGLGDRMRIQVASRGDDDIKFCGIAIYKEYT